MAQTSKVYSCVRVAGDAAKQGETNAVLAELQMSLLVITLGVAVKGLCVIYRDIPGCKGIPGEI